MKRFNYKKYLLFGLLLFSVVSLPLAFVQGVRVRIIRSIFPVWQGANKLFGSKQKENLERIQRLEIENHLLRVEIGKLGAEREKKYALESLQKELSQEKKRQKEVQHLLQSEIASIPATIIYRDPGTWGSSLWINVGNETHEIVKKNSPVLFGRSVVGVIDYVGKKQSRVKLITDATIKPAVRAARGKPQNIFLQENIDILLRHLKARGDLAHTRDILVKELEGFKEKISCDVEAWYLAKGILQGAKTPFCRNLKLLWGFGFNYDFADKEGPARELALGRAKEPGFEPVPILKVGDLLITTGMDGIFPPGLRVAEVARIEPLREGAYSYEIEAYPSCGNLDDLTVVFVIAPLGFDHEEQLSAARSY